MLDRSITTSSAFLERNNSFSTQIPFQTHSYHDYSQQSVFPIHECAVNQQNGGRVVDNPFPVRLHYMLSEVEKDGLSHIVSWQPHGRCFLVHNQTEFVKRVLPCWFRQSKLSSFQRQLNLYGFKRLTNATDKGGYYHEFFLRSMPNLCYSIKRTKIKGTGTRKPSSPETEPNFYLMPYLPSNPLRAAQDTTITTNTNTATIVGSGVTSSSAPMSLATGLGNRSSAADHAGIIGCLKQLETSGASLPIHSFKPGYAVQLPLLALATTAAMGNTAINVAKNDSTTVGATVSGNFSSVR